MSMNPMGAVNPGYQNHPVETCQGGDDEHGRRSSGDIYSRRSSKAVVSRNFQIGDTSPIFSRANRVLPSELPISVGTQTVSEMGTQTMSILESRKPPSPLPHEAQLIFTRSTNSSKTDAPSAAGKGIKYPLQPPPLPLPNMNESSPDQPWKLILRNIEEK